MSRDARDSAGEHLSVSQAKQCLAKTAFSRIAGIKDEPSASMAFGTYFHALAERAYKQEQKPAEIPEGLTKGAKLQAEKLFAEYWKRIGAGIFAANGSTRAELRFEFREWTKRPIIGYIDLLHSAGGARVADLKTKGRPAEFIRSDEVLQLSTYRAALSMGPGPAELHVACTEGDGEVYTLEHDEFGARVVSQADIDCARARFQILDASWESRIFMPEPGPLCKYCAAFRYCNSGQTFDGRIDEWMKRRSEVTATNVKDSKKEGEKMAEMATSVAPDILAELEDGHAIRAFLKVALVGEFGTLKTRTALGFPAPVVVDTERGTDHYGTEFPGFKRLKLEGESREYFGKVTRLLRALGKNPGDRRTFEMDSWSVYCERVESAFADIYLGKEKSAGNKGDYYTLQPRDYKPIQRELMKQINAMMRLNMHVIVTMQEKDKWAAGDELKVIGKTFDGFKRTPYYFDTVIFLRKVTDPKTGKERVVGKVEKDRTGALPNVLDPFGIDILKQHWAVFFDQESAPTDNVMEEPVVILAGPSKAAVQAAESIAAQPLLTEGGDVQALAKIIDDKAKPEAPAAGAVVEEPAAPPLKADMLKTLLDLRNILQIPEDKWTEIIKKRGAKKPEKLTVVQIVELRAKLEEKLSEPNLAAWLKLHPWRVDNQGQEPGEVSAATIA